MANAVTERATLGRVNSARKSSYATEFCGPVVKGAGGQAVTERLTMNRVNSVRAALFATGISGEDAPDSENGDVHVVCKHILLFGVTKFLEKHESLGFRIRFDPDKYQDLSTNDQKIMGKLIAVEIPTLAHEATAFEITDQIKDSVRTIVVERTS